MQFVKYIDLWSLERLNSIYKEHYTFLTTWQRKVAFQIPLKISYPHIERYDFFIQH